MTTPSLLGTVGERCRARLFGVIRGGVRCPCGAVSSASSHVGNWILHLPFGGLRGPTGFASPLELVRFSCSWKKKVEEKE